RCGAALASRRRGVTPYLALWSPDFPRRLSPTRTSSLLGFAILAFYRAPAGARTSLLVRGPRDLANEPSCPRHVLVDRDSSQFAVIDDETIFRVLTRDAEH